MFTCARLPALRARRLVSRTSGAALAALAGSLSLVATSLPANAQLFRLFGGERTYVEEPSPAIPAPEIYRRLLNRGYQLNSAMQRNGGVYLADVIDPAGRQQRLVIDAYRGRILQIFAYGPPRPSGLVPDGAERPPVGAGPSYASREPVAPPSALPGQDPRDPRVIPGIGPQRNVEQPARVKRKTKTASRESTPKGAPATKPSAVSPSEATAPPAAAPQPGAPVEAASPPPSVPSKAAIAPSAPAAAPAEAPARAATAPAKPEGGNKPGYANGVPINPLD